MLKDTIEKIFVIPFFKLIEILYSQKNDDDYEMLKEQYFGKQFDNLKILNPFRKQIETLNELLFLTRPDILAKSEKIFFDNYLDESILKSGNKFENNIRDYYNQAIIIQKNESINCQTKAETKSIAKELNFPIEFDNKIKKKCLCVALKIVILFSKN